MKPVTFMQAAARALSSAKAGDALSLSSVRLQGLQALIPRRGKIIGIGLNYRDHAKASNLAVPDFPTVFAKYSKSWVAKRMQPLAL